MSDLVNAQDPATIIAGIRQFGLAADSSDLRDLEAAIERLQHGGGGEYDEAREDLAFRKWAEEAWPNRGTVPSLAWPGWKGRAQLAASPPAPTQGSELAVLQGKELRELAKNIGETLLESQAVGPAHGIVSHCLNHLRLLAGFHERQRIPAENAIAQALAAAEAAAAMKADCARVADGFGSFVGEPGKDARPLSGRDVAAAIRALPPAAPASGETQQSCAEWADETFGPVSSNARIAARANEEMAELLRALTVDDSHEKAVEEACDIVIILYRLATKMGRDLHAEIDTKMAVNRKREWNQSGDGHGYHVRDKTAPPEGGGDE